MKGGGGGGGFSCCNSKLMHFYKDFCKISAQLACNSMNGAAGTQAEAVTRNIQPETQEFQREYSMFLAADLRRRPEGTNALCGRFNISLNCGGAERKTRPAFESKKHFKRLHVSQRL